MTIEELRKIVEAATAGPWSNPWDLDEDDEKANGIWAPTKQVVGVAWYDGAHLAFLKEDAAFIAAARTALPALLDFVEAVRWLVKEGRSNEVCFKLEDLDERIK